MNINLIKKPKAEMKNQFKNSTPLDNRFGFWGVVVEVHPEDCTVHVRMDNGYILSGVRVASMEWVTVAKNKHLTGERHLPPVDTFVFCLMPNGEYSSAFVLCSGFARQQAIHADFKEKSEDAKNTWERVENSGWYKKVDYRNGSLQIKNKTDEEATVQLEINQENEKDEKVKIVVHDTEINIEKDKGVSISTNKNIKIKSTQSELLEIGNSIETLGKMMSDLMQEITELKTFGSPASHTVMPDSIAKITALKTKWEQVFK